MVLRWSEWKAKNTHSLIRAFACKVLWSVTGELEQVTLGLNGKSF